MRPNRILWLVVCLTAGLALAIAMSAGGAGASPRAVADQSWTDPAGDAQGGAPDITALTVGNEATGIVTVVITAPITADTFVGVTLDTDLNSKADHDLFALGTGAGVASPMTSAVDASGDWNPISVPSLRFVATATTLTFSFAKADLGIDMGFTIFGWSVTGSQANDPNASYGDAIPDGGAVLMYVIATPPTTTTTTTTTPAPVVVKPVIGAPVTTPRTAIAGKRMTVTFPVTRSDNGRPLTSGRMVCDPSVAGKVIKHAESFRAGKAKLSFTVPKTAKGKLLKVKVTIEAGTQSTTRIATFRVT